jgi:diadenosine tetraphosphate (Ap4A) HIT family hydrolase
LVLPKLHIPDYFDIPNTSITDIMGLVDMVRAKLKMTLKPDGFNIGINCGRAAGQTVDHAHIHVIPRYTGDLPDPRGGVRWVIPEKAKYW